MPSLTVAFAAMVAIGLLAQLRWPDLLAAGQRDAVAIIDGQGYRLFTSLWLQDAGLAGGAFNLAMLATIGPAGEAVLMPRSWVGAYVGGGVLAGIAGMWLQPIGAGNSIAYMSLAGAILADLGRQSVAGRICWVRFVGVIAGVILLLLRDVHGAALAIGYVLFWSARAGMWHGRSKNPPGSDDCISD